MRLSQENLEKMTKDEITSLAGRKANDRSENKFGDVTIISVKRNSKSYDVTFTTSIGIGKYTYIENYTGFLELN